MVKSLCIIRASLFRAYRIHVMDKRLMLNTGECKDVMMGYLECMKQRRGMNDPECRNLAKSYLGCRMDRSVKTLYLA